MFIQPHIYLKNLTLFFFLVMVLVVLCSPRGWAQKKDLTFLAEEAFYGSQPEMVQKYLTEAAEIGQSTLSLQLVANSLALRSGKITRVTNFLADIANSAQQFSDLQRGKLLNLRGELLIVQGDLETALEILEDAAQLLQQHKPALAKCLSDQGLALWQLKDSFAALSHHQQALELRRKLFGNDHPAVAASLNNIGLVHAGDAPDKASQFYRDALSINKKAYGQQHPSVIATYNNLAVLYWESGDMLKATELFATSLNLSETVYGPKHPNIAFLKGYQAKIAINNGQNEAANLLLNEALNIYEHNFGEKHPEITNLLNLKGNLFLDERQYEKALSQYQAALMANHLTFSSTDLQKNPNIEEYIQARLLVNTLLLKAGAFEARHTGRSLRFSDLKAALAALERADELIAVIRSRKAHQQDKIALGLLANQVYAQAIGLCLRMARFSIKPNYYRAKAFLFSEKSKAVVLLQSISETKAKKFAGIPDRLLQKEKELKESISMVEQQLALQTSDSLQNKRFSLFKEYTQFVNDLERDFPSYYQLKYDASISTVTDVQAGLSADEMVISYFISEENQQIYCFYLSHNNLQVWETPMPERFYAYLSAYRTSLEYQTEELYTEMAYELYRVLFPKNIKKHVQKLTIIPDGALATIPFEALLLKEVDHKETIIFSDLSYFLLQTSISYHFSATLMLADRKEGKAKPIKDVLLYAPVNFKGNGQDVAKDRLFLSSLPGTSEEIENIANIFSQTGKGVETRLFDQAEEGYLKTQPLRQFGLLHFATHGLVDEDRPELSKILMAAPLAHDNEDGNLYSGEIYNLQLGAELVTLSACQTGLGQISKGEGIIGLSRAFLYAGAQNLIVSLWSVADASTSQFMVSFYREQAMEASSIKGFRASLQMAKQQMIAEGTYADPYYWAPFILIGR